MHALLEMYDLDDLDTTSALQDDDSNAKSTAFSPLFFLDFTKIPAFLSVRPRNERHANTCDKVAQCLAGMDNNLKSPSYLEYAKIINDEWHQLEETSFGSLKEWVHKNISPFVSDANAVFYPFGGPDVVYPIKFFPLVRNYVLVGLELTGDFASLENSLQKESTFPALRKAFSHYLKKGYFITSEMAKQLHNKNVKGTLCFILLELAKLGFRIDSVEEIAIDVEGNEISRSKQALNCVKITFTKNNGTLSRKIYYVRADLSNSNKKLKHLKNFMQRWHFVALVKSASYIMHNDLFSTIRKFILQNSRAILQDDSGIPFRCFDRNWTKLTFGQYSAPTLLAFKNCMQPDLFKYYNTHEKIEIPFKIGYGFDQGKPNLLLAIPVPNK
jgi:hypothetical protein